MIELTGNFEIPMELEFICKEFKGRIDRESSEHWEKEVERKESTYHKNEILEGGQVNFDEPKNGITSEQLIKLYNSYYFRKHLQSSYWIYMNLFKERVLSPEKAFLLFHNHFYYFQEFLLHYRFRI